MRRFLYPAAYKVLAIGVLVVLLGIALSIGVSRVGGEVTNESTQGIIECFSASLQGGDVTQGVALASSWKDRYEREASQTFEEEVMPVSDLYPLVSSDGLTVGFTYNAPCDEAASFVREHVEERGWRFVESGESAFFTFVKDTGVYTWLGVTCVEGEDCTSVVMQVIEGGKAYAS